MKKSFILFLIVGLMSVELFANGLTGLNAGGTKTQESVLEFMNAWKFIFAFVPMGVGGYLFMKTNEYITNQEKTNAQTEPSWVKRGKCVMGFFAGVFLVFIVYGVAGLMFGSGTAGFMGTWNSLVTSFWSQFFS